MKFLILAIPLLSACTVAPLKEAVEGAVHRRVDARQEAESVQVCSCNTQYESPTHGSAKLNCSIAEIPNS